MARKAEEISKEARIAIEKWQQYFSVNIKQYHEMHGFILGRQWTTDEEDMLKTYRKVPLQFNKLATLANTLVGEQQQNTPQIQIKPKTNCNYQAAKIREDLTKNIMFSNHAQTVYQVAGSQACIGGFGAYYWDTQYTHNRSFDQDPVLRYVKDATKCFWDTGAEHVNKIDGMVAGFITRMTRQKFRSIFGKKIEKDIIKESSIIATKEEVALATDSGANEEAFSWSDNNGITVVDYYKRKQVKHTLYKMSNGSIYDQDELNELIEQSIKINEQMQMQQMQQPQDMQQPDMQPPMEQQDDRVMLWDNGEQVRIEDSDERKKSVIMHYKIAGEWILEESEFPSEDIPLIFVDQNSFYDKEGKQVCRPFLIDAIDAQRYLNYVGTQSAYILKVSRYDQFIGSKKNVQSNDTKTNWKNPNDIQGLLTYDESPSGAKPEQLRPPELSQSLLTQYQRAIDDMYTSTGLYPTRMGQQGNEVSGAAIDARTRQGSYSTYGYFNSINRAITSGGIILNQMIPRVYDSERVISLINTEDGAMNVTINQQVDDYGLQIENDIRKGTYEVILVAGPSYEGQKQEALTSLKEVLQVNPQLFSLVADLYADNLPLANNIELKNRLKTIVPPDIIEAGKTGKMPNQNGQKQPSPEEQQMQMQQQQMQMDQQYKQQQLEIKKQELALKAKQMQIDLEIEQQKLQAEEIAVMGEIEESKMRYMAETDRTESDASISHANNLVKILTHKIQ